MKATFPAQLYKVNSKVDRSYSLTFVTRELGGVEAVALLDDLMNEGWLMWSSDNDLTDADVPDEKADSMTGQKTQAQRLRAVIYRLWEQKGKKGDSESYYRSIMESLIEQVKERLE